MIFEGHHFQNAYITRDLDKAVETVKALGVVEHLRHDADIEVRTSRGAVRMGNRIFMGWVGDLQYELIQPVVDELGLYTDALPGDDGLKFHHSCTRVDDWDRFRAGVDEKRLVLEGGHEQLRFCYIDARDIVGHYLEYNWMRPEMWKAIGGH